MKHNILLEGTIGTGKTTSLRSIIEETDKELFICATEPGIETILGDMPEDRCHWQFISPAQIDWETIKTNALLVNSQNADFLQKTPGQNRHEYQQFLDVLACCANFIDDRTGKEFGKIDDFGEDKVFTIDGMSGLSRIVRNLTVGPKIIMSLPEYMLSQETLLTFTDKLCNDLKCNFILTSHIARERDEVTGGNHITIDTIGVKLAPKVIKPFDEIIYAYREGAKFKWSTSEADVDLKSRVLPLSSNLVPGFGQIFNGEVR